ncbi:MAG: hypothetical protein DRJ26_00930 [Candidatus Methanomethylicota archaeon]|uniref:YkgJ family cysteine cluster protein n=1 Tax=Thermoproteota archaeon TaxID=2056631 RepID=A0A497F7H3_9CREN|nr:MAG: hypothetical protein DRJ26_00930 [Candidatus Verstraetearchaeota archaeon]
MRRGHNYIGWKEAERWRCIRCGMCCRAFAVPLKFIEALQLTRKYGPIAIQAGGKYYLMKKPDDSCIFLAYNGPIAYCKIYLERPGCCKLYPFHVAKKPLQGVNPSTSEFKIRGKVLHVYVDAACPGVGRGFPIRNLIPKVIELWAKYSGII